MVWHRKNLPKSLPKSVPTIQNGCCPNWSVWPRDECLCYLQLHINPVNKFMREKRNHMRASHSLSLSLSLTHTLALSHSVFLSLSHSHTHTHSLPLISNLNRLHPDADIWFQGASFLLPIISRNPKILDEF